MSDTGKKIEQEPVGDSREKFERWYSQHWLNRASAVAFSKQGDKYIGYEPRVAWSAWQAALRAQSQAEPVAFAWLYSTNSGDWLSLLPPDEAAKTWHINNAIPLYTHPAKADPEILAALRDARELLALTFPEQMADFCRDGCDECVGEIEDCPGNCPVRTAPPLVDRLSAILAAHQKNGE